CGMLLVPALPDIGTTSLFAHRVQPILTHDLARRRIAARNRRLDPDPIRLLQQRRIRPMRLFRIARPLRRGGRGVEDDPRGNYPATVYLRMWRAHRKAGRRASRLYGPVIRDASTKS